jgi:queuine tRNA-ribosyltransferase
MKIVERDGLLLIADSTTGELMHSGVEPFRQAEVLYIEQTRIKDLKKEPIVIWDVGLGAGINALSAIKSLPNKKIVIESFEITKEPLVLGKKLHQSEELVDSLLNNGFYKDSNISWRVLWGDFRDTVKEAQRPDIIFWDPFSMKTNPKMWEGRTLELLTQYGFHERVILSTYSSSTRFRGGLIGLGWWLGTGVPISGRKETTIAGGKEIFNELGIPRLDLRYRDKFRQSHAPYPEDLKSVTLESILDSSMWG